MIRLKFKLVRDFGQSFDPGRLINDVVERIKANNRGIDIFDDHIGFGFSIMTEKPKTLKNFLYRSGSLFPRSASEGANRLKSIING